MSEGLHLLSKGAKCKTMFPSFTVESRCYLCFYFAHIIEERRIAALRAVLQYTMAYVLEAGSQPVHAPKPQSPERPTHFVVVETKQI